MFDDCLEKFLSRIEIFQGLGISYWNFHMIAIILCPFQPQWSFLERDLYLRANQVRMRVWLPWSQRSSSWILLRNSLLSSETGISMLWGRCSAGRPSSLLLNLMYVNHMISHTFLSIPVVLFVHVRIAGTTRCQDCWGNQAVCVQVASYASRQDFTCHTWVGSLRPHCVSLCPNIETIWLMFQACNTTDDFLPLQTLQLLSWWKRKLPKRNSWIALVLNKVIPLVQSWHIACTFPCLMNLHLIFCHIWDACALFSCILFKTVAHCVALILALHLQSLSLDKKLTKLTLTLRTALPKWSRLQR